MLVKHEIKSQLAKLLATEDLIVEHKRVEPAECNVHTRVLILPIWERASNDVYDMLVGHEVGHALFTPDRDYWLEHKIPPQFVNIVEDARIEKLMKRKYMGIAKSFYRGYNELHDRDFFELDGEDLSNFNLADRANLHFKIGSFLPMVFSTAEKSIIRMIEECETFDDTLEVAEILYQYCKKEIEDKKPEMSDDEVAKMMLDECLHNAGMKEESPFDDKDTDGMTDEELLEELNKPQKEDPAQLDVPSFRQGGDLELKSVDALEDSLKDLSSMNGRDSVYVELPELDLKDIIIPNKLLHDELKETFIQQEKEWKKNDYLSLPDMFDEVDEEYIKFKKNAQKEVSYLVKEFECKKSADAYARSTTARTGVLDTVKLHTYKFNEDLFKKVNVIPDGKNHGLVFILDWSGSMGPVMLDTIKQLYNLIWFCKKVQIPFEVYAFTNNYPAPEGGFHKNGYQKREGLVLVDETFSLMNMFTSKVNAKLLEEQMLHIFRLACAFSTKNYYCLYNVPIGFNLSGTPLNETIIALHQILPQFKKENNLQKVQCVILTDGEGQPVRFSKEIQRRWDDLPFIGSAYFDENVIIRNRKTGCTYSCKGVGRWGDISDILLRDLRQSFSDMNFIGIRILASRDAGHFVRHYAGHDESYEKIMKTWRREKAFSIKNSGYHTYFGIASSILGNDGEFDVVEDATKAEIKRAFVKSLKSKKMNKKILGEFIELVA